MNNIDSIKVSIIIPVYNVMQYVEECLYSAINQTYSNIEIIVVDDGSTDKSGKICDIIASKDGRVFVYHKQNGGLGDARNYGLDHASGDYVYFLDSDDWIVNYTIETLVNEVQKESLDVLMFDARCIDENGEELLNDDFYHAYYRMGKYNCGITGRELLAEFINQNEFRPAVPLMLIKRAAIDIKFKKIIHEDELFTVQLLCSVDKAGYYPGIFYVRRFRRNSIVTAEKNHRHFEGLYEVLEGIAQIPNRDQIIEKRMQFIYNYAKTTYLFLNKKEKKIAKKTKKKLEIIRKQNNLKSKKLIILFIKKKSNKQLKKFGRFILKPIKIQKQKISYKKEYRKFKDILGTNKKHILLVGTPIHGNLGDHMIAMAAKELLMKSFADSIIIEMEKNLYEKLLHGISAIIKEEDIIVINGGGWMGNQWPQNEALIRQTVKTFKNRIIILPQTIYYEQNELVNKDIEMADYIYTNNKNLTIFLRDNNSYQFAVEHNYPNCFLVPDLALYFQKDYFSFNRNGILLIRRDDREKHISENVWKDIENYIKSRKICFYHCRTNVLPVTIEDREKTVERKLKEIAQAKLVITDRLHAMIFSAITGTPCIAFDNSSQKLSGVYQWISNLEYINMVNKIDEVYEIMESVLVNQKKYNYNMPSFDFLISNIKEEKEV